MGFLGVIPILESKKNQISNISADTVFMISYIRRLLIYGQYHVARFGIIFCALWRCLLGWTIMAK